MTSMPRTFVKVSYRESMLSPKIVTVAGYQPHGVALETKLKTLAARHCPIVAVTEYTEAAYDPPCGSVLPGSLQ